MLQMILTIFSFTHVYRIGVDEWLRVPSVEDVFAIGDCSGFLESTGKPTLPALAQVSHMKNFLPRSPYHLPRSECFSAMILAFA